jgi:hypothetical protein
MGTSGCWLYHWLGIELPRAEPSATDILSLVIISSRYAWSWRGVIVEKSIFRDGGSSGDWSDEVVPGDLCMAVFVDA